MVFNLIINYQNVTLDQQECPFKKISVPKESKEVSDSKNLQKKCNIQKRNYVKSLYSGVLLEIQDTKDNCLQNIKWVISAVDIADAILTSLASRTILIIEGPPGIGKTAISISIFQYLNINIERINIYPSTQKEDIFSNNYCASLEQKIILALHFPLL